MLQILGKIPREPFAVACSGGVDSMVMVDFLRRFPKFQFKLLYFNHGTEHGQEAEEFLKKFSTDAGIYLEIGHISQEKPNDRSPEEHWRIERYKFFDSFGGTIAMAHNLDDCVETWLFSSIRGQSKIIPYRRNQVIRPFLMVSKAEIRQWAEKNAVRHVEDASNEDLKYTRNLIRHELVPVAMKVNPGIHKMLKKMIKLRGI